MAFTDFFDLLRETEPITAEYDVEWWGPFFIPRSRSWLPTHFMLYGGTLYGSMEIGWSRSVANWNIKTGEVSFDRTSSLLSPVADSRELWERAIPQLGRKLETALLITIRPEAPAHICWDPIPELRPITEEQRRRLQYVLLNGSPAGWK